MDNVVYIPLPKETIVKINELKSKDEKIEDFIEKIIEEQFLMRETFFSQVEKMKELWDNEEDNIWDKLK